MARVRAMHAGGWLVAANSTWLLPTSHHGGTHCTAGVESLLEDMVAADAEWSKLSAIPGLLEPWNDVRDKWHVATDEFKARMGRQHAGKCCCTHARAKTHACRSSPATHAHPVHLPQVVVLDALARKKAEAAAYNAALSAALGERDSQARALVAAYERSRKEALRLRGGGLSGVGSTSGSSGGVVVTEEQVQHMCNNGDT